MIHNFFSSILIFSFFTPINAQNLQAVKLTDSQIPKSVKYKGKLVDAFQWKDISGDNILITSWLAPVEEKTKDEGPVQTAELFAYHYCKKDTAYKILWRLNDIEKKCPFDITAGFIKGSTAITDLNKNGIAETTVQYKLGCRSDVSPSTMKVIMHEDSVKYALRGNMWLQVDEKGKFLLNENNANLEKLPKKTDEFEQLLQSYGRYETEKDFTYAPGEFLSFARQRWLKYVKETFD